MLVDSFPPQGRSVIIFGATVYFHQSLEIQGWIRFAEKKKKGSSSSLDDFLLSGKWTEEEEKRLAEVVHELTSTEPGDIVTQGVSWAAVAERVGTRSEKQCRSKWLNYLNWKQSGGTEWTKEDEINLILRFVS